MHRANAMGFEPAERIGDLPAKEVVERSGNGRVNRPSIAGCDIVGVAEVCIARTADDVITVGFDFFDKQWNRFRLMLFVAIHGDNPVIVFFVAIIKCIDDALPITEVFGVPDDVDSRFRRQNIRGPVGAAIINDEDIEPLLADAFEHAGDVFLLIMYGNSD